MLPKGGMGKRENPKELNKRKKSFAFEEQMLKFNLPESVVERERKSFSHSHFASAINRLFALPINYRTPGERL